MRQPFGDAATVGFRPVLAHFPLAFDRLDLDLDADNAAQLAFDVGSRRIADRPRGSTAFLMSLGESFDLRVEPSGIGTKPCHAAGLNHRVIPCWHDLTCFAFCRIQGGAYIGLRPLKHGEYLLAINVAPLTHCRAPCGPGAFREGRTSVATEMGVNLRAALPIP